MTHPKLSELRVLVVDDEADIRLGISRLLGTLGIQSGQAADGLEALSQLRNQEWDLVLTDLMMPSMTGAELLAEIKKTWPDIAVVLLTGFGTVQTAVQCVQSGASHFLTKPFDNEEILGIVQRLGLQLLAKRQSSPSGVGVMVAEDPATKRVLSLVEKVAPQTVPVLIEGESGSGKEVIARAIHRKSAVSELDFQAVNCAALSDTLLESELFGHVRGAFTGAERDRRGLFALAEGGTVFLDEVSSMSPAFQGKLLRVLQEKVIRPVGGSEDVPVSFRLIAATNRDLGALVQAGKFREDLYYRLQVVQVHIPPLRERPADIVPLAMHFLLRATQECMGEEATPPEIGQETLQKLRTYEWPGNVRELENAIQRALIVCCGERLMPFHLGLDSQEWSGSTNVGEQDYSEAKAQAMQNFQREFVQRALEKSRGNVTQAASSCGLTRAAFQKILKQLGVDRSRFSSEEN